MTKRNCRGPEERLRMVYYDVEQKTWLPLPSRVDAKNNLLSAESDHLTVFDITFDEWEEARLPNLQDFQVSEFTAAAVASYAFWTPPGPAGLQPSLALSYNSQAVDNAIAGHTQASWVGMGWSLNTGYIERDMRGTPDRLDDDTFAISAAGVDSRMLLGQDGRYHTLDEAFWRIEYDEPNDLWRAWDKRGTQYIFGDTTNSRAYYPYEFDEQCEDPPSHIHYKTWRWSLSKLRNVSGQELSYTYTNDAQVKRHRCFPQITAATIIAVYPQTILYPNQQYRVSFDLETRLDYNPTWENIGSLNFYERYRLKTLRLERLGGAGFETIRRYELSYAPAIFPGVSWGAGQATQALVAIQESRTIGAATHTLPAVSYAYDGLHLVSAANGYGGAVNFIYEPEPWRAQGIDLRTKHRAYAPPSGCKEISPGVYQPYFIPTSGSQVFCLNHINDLYLKGGAYLPIPAGMLQPGAIYRLALELFKPRGMGTAADVQVGLLYAAGGYQPVAALTLGINQGVSISQEALLPASASYIYLYTCIAAPTAKYRRPRPPCCRCATACARNTCTTACRLTR